MSRLPRTILPALPLLLASLSAAEEPSRKPYVARVEVQARSAVLVLTDAKEQPLDETPALADLEVKEDGALVTVLGLDRVEGEPPSPLAAAPAPAAAPAAPSRPAAKKAVPRQVLYVDATCLRQQSLRLVVDAINKDLPRILAMGPLEVVVADPKPRVAIAATSDTGSLTLELNRLASSLSGRDRIAKLRRQLVTDQENLAYDSVSLHFVDNSWAGEANAAATAREEVAILVGSLSRLVGWGTAERPATSGILYLASDGFDTDLSAFYGAGAGSLGGLVATAGSALAGAGWIVMPVALGAPAELSSSLTADQNGWGRDGRPVLLSSHRLDSLQHVAEETGGTVVGYASQLPAAVRALASRFVLTYRVSRPPDGKLHALEVKSLRKGMVVQAARTVAAGSTASLSTSRALAALRGEGEAADLPVEALVTEARSGKKGSMKATLVVRAKLLAIRDLLPVLGAGRMRVTLAVPVPGGPPFLHHEERELKSLGSAVGWEFHLPLDWPEKTTRAAVVVEELGTGAWGAATVALPHGADETAKR